MIRIVSRTFLLRRCQYIRISNTIYTGSCFQTCDVVREREIPIFVQHWNQTFMMSAMHTKGQIFSSNVRSKRLLHTVFQNGFYARPTRLHPVVILYATSAPGPSQIAPSTETCRQTLKAKWLQNLLNLVLSSEHFYFLTRPKTSNCRSVWKNFPSINIQWNSCNLDFYLLLCRIKGPNSSLHFVIETCFNST